MPNMKSVINNHNKTILEKQENPERTGNCLQKDSCLLSNECLETNIVSEATVTSNKPNYVPRTYMTEPIFKARFANHKKAFNHQRYENDSVLFERNVESEKEKF